MHLIDAAHGGVDRGQVANVAGDELDVGLDLPQPAQGAAGIIVEHAHGVAVAHERLDQSGADEAAAAGHQDTPGAHERHSPVEGATAIQRPDACA
jgi:hypothetical protein